MVANTSGAGLARQVEKWMREAAPAFPAKRASIIPMLQAAQAKFGYLPSEAMAGIAKRLRMPAAEVQGIATFYAQFRFQPAGEHRVTVCRGTACHVRGSGKLLDEISATLGVRAGETTSNGKFTLETVACFGSCALAPVLVADGKVYGRQTTAAARKTLDALGRARPAKGSKSKPKSRPESKPKSKAGAGSKPNGRARGGKP